MKVEDKQRLERTERMMVGCVCGVCLKSRISSEELNARLEVKAISKIVRRGRLRWYGHLERKSSDDWVSACRDYEVVGQKSRGKGRKTWAECVKHDLKSLGLMVEWAQNRNEWKNLIRGNRPAHANMEKRTLKRK